MKLKSVVLRLDVIAQSLVYFCSAQAPVSYESYLLHEFPIYFEPRRPPLLFQNVVQQELFKMLNGGIITPATSAREFPSVVVTRRDWRPRLHIDSRPLSKNWKPDGFPLPKMKENFEDMHSCSYSTTLDLVSRIWPIPVAKHFKDMTTLTCKFVHSSLIPCQLG